MISRPEWGPSFVDKFLDPNLKNHLLHISNVTTFSRLKKIRPPSLKFRKVQEITTNRIEFI